MGIEEQVGEVSGKAITVMGERPLMLGILLLAVAAFGFATWQNHDNEAAHQATLLKVLEYRHEEMRIMLDKLEQALSQGHTHETPSAAVSGKPGYLKLEGME
jgi:hypothetical protein